MNFFKNLLRDLRDPLASRVGYINDPAVTTGPIVWLSMFGVTVWLTLPEISVTPIVLDREPVKTIAYEVK